MARRITAAQGDAKRVSRRTPASTSDGRRSSRYWLDGGTFAGRMNLKVAAASVTVFLIAACQLPGSTSTCNAQIDWVNFVQVGSTQYVAGPQSPSTITEGDLGPVYAHVKFKVSGNVCDPNYRLKDGDAAFLDSGTPIYQVTGHAPSEELAAPFNGNV